MKKITVLVMMIVITFTQALPVFAEASPATDQQSVEALVRNIIEEVMEQEKEDTQIAKLVDEINQSVVAVIGKNKTYRQQDYIYSKMPNNLQHGSGVIVSSNGQIITNNHVVTDMEEIYVVMYDGKAYKAQLLYNDEEIDLALIKINRDNLKPIALENVENVKVGNTVIAIGTPLYFSYRNSASRGIISGLNRPVDQMYTYLQTDASINPGNSGGPLVNMEGKLVGINTLGYMFYSGMNFAIPVENVSYFLDHYKQFGRIKRCYTGIQFEENWAAMLGIPTTQGLRVVTLRNDAVVSSSEVQEGDMLEAIDGIRTSSIAAYNEILKKHLPGDEVTLTFSRQGESFDIKIILKERP
ncbi:S1C family serine protease [Clostridium formicaceticum]|uniref:2-alkenal reductase n=1 Tax=Clostridium formicaceticum TaxID=1497 RepID=A0AAC9RNK6_9CLOT|nr:trypsin-like peptidase domain-containing protein [Clostridium formicaceticum]AOY74887.1 2-alkenal reductase [Clostridium formicaceticum]ARE89291.1 Putative serine protease HtrA [Clostridium formicaceticum]